jgi:hypothetical protein
MRALGHPATWPTDCFIGCTQQVWAHTNGFGDFVLFDELGWPWPVHDCYLNLAYCGGSRPSPTSRFTLASATLGDDFLSNVSAECRKLQVPRPPKHAADDIQRMNPQDWLEAKTFRVSGYVQDYIENRVSALLKGARGIVEQSLLRLLGNRRSQLTVIDQERNSFTFVADLRSTVVSAGSVVSAQIRAVTPLLPKGGCLFLCESIDVLQLRRIRPR